MKRLLIFSFLALALVLTPAVALVSPAAPPGPVAVSAVAPLAAGPAIYQGASDIAQKPNVVEILGLILLAVIAAESSYVVFKIYRTLKTPPVEVPKAGKRGGRRKGVESGTSSGKRRPSPRKPRAAPSPAAAPAAPAASIT
jgi:hypothetical protein